jgi:hypothetical protein
MKKTQADAVVEVMEQNGGYATLGHLYQKVLNVPGVTWKSRTPFASMRRIVQLDPRIFRIQPGLWALETHRDTLPFIVQEDTPKKAREEFNHSYFQGLLVEIGNFRRLATYVPPQDKNHDFLGGRLDDVTTIKALLPFSYDEILRNAKTVDVIWFNDRKMPSAFLEVEHSTDIYNSLRKFFELQDFHAEFAIVAPEARKAEFETKRNAAAYKPIAKRVRFWGYEEVARMHGNLAELAAMEMMRYI